MAKLSKEQIMVGAEMAQRGTSVRQVARQLGVTEGALRYRLKQRAADPKPDGRSLQPTSVDEFEEAVAGILEGLDCRRVTGEGRPVQARAVYRRLVRDYEYAGSYRAVVRHLGRRYGVPAIRALRRVETPPGVQAQHDWFTASARIGGKRTDVQALVGVLSHSRARFCWISPDATQLAWHSGHLALFQCYGGVPLWVRIDNLKTGVASGAGPTAVLNRSYEVFARSCGFEIDPCRAHTGSDKGKAERSVRTFRDCFGDLFGEDWLSMDALQAALYERSGSLMDRLACPITGTSVRVAWEAERRALQPLPSMEEPFDVVVSRRVHRDCLVSFEGRRYSVPFQWVGRQVEVLGTHRYVMIRAEGQEIARHLRHTQALLVLEPDHFEGDSTDRVLRPSPLGHRARLQMAGLTGP
ncbi:MAG: IS21 family transposase, partial [Actinomycetota bacterium]